MKHCQKCGQDKPESEFHKDKTKPDGLTSCCKACRTAYAREYYEKHKDKFTLYHKQYYISNAELEEFREKNRASNKAWRVKQTPEQRHNRWLRDAHGIDRDMYFYMYTQQEGKCAICQTHQQKLCIDHDHKTGRLRGLLCSTCNTGIGHLKDSPELLQQASLYLTTYAIGQQ